MKNAFVVCVFFILSVSFTAYAQKVDDPPPLRGGITGSITDGGVSFAYSSFGADAANANLTGTATGDNLFEYGWYFRVPGDTRETSFNNPNTGNYAGDTATLDWSDVAARGLFSAQEVTVVNEVAAGQGTVSTSIEITNISGAELTLNVFHYVDIDAGGSFGGDNATLTNSPDFMTVTDGGNTLEYRAGGNDFYTAGAFGAAELGLNDTDVDDFANTGLPFGPGDFTGAYQWMDLVIPAGLSITLEVSLGGNTPAPVPAAPMVGGLVTPDVAASVWDFTSTPNANITVGAPVSDTINVTNIGPVILDINLITSITHTFASDLDITLTSPSGTTVTVTTDNGGGSDDIFDGTLFDDDAVDTSVTNTVTEFAHVNGVTSTPLVIEEALGAFIGEDPNGIWTLDIVDDAGGDDGTLAEWTLSITHLPDPFINTPFSGTDMPGSNITVGTPVNAMLTISGAGEFICDVDMETFITHTFASDLDITLTSPAGTVVPITTDNGGGNDDVFDGTTWDDNADAPVTDFTFTNNVTATPLTPEGAMGAFVGEDPNGTWVLTIVDDAGGDDGTLAEWSLNGQTCLVPPPVADADLSITKTDSADPVSPGDPLTYTVTVDNAGPADATNVVVTDTLPAGVTFVSTSGCAEDPAGVPTCSLGTIPSGGSAMYTISVTVDAGTSGTITNTASVTSDTNDPDTGNNMVSEDTLVAAEADLSITKTDAPDPVVAGTALTYTVTVNNAGPSTANNVVVTDMLPVGVTLDSTSGCAEDPAGVPTCSLGSIASGASAAFTINVNVDPSITGTITNMASVTADENDPNPGDNSVSEDTTVIASADLSIAKMDSADPVTAGDQFDYNISVTNNGPSDAAGVVVTDNLPAGVTLVSTSGCAEDPNGAPTCSLGTIPAGITANYSITVQVDLLFSGVLSNTASVSSSTSDPNGGNNSATENTTVNAAQSDLVLTISNNAMQPVELGDMFDIVMDLSNAGPQDNVNVMVNGMLSGGLAFVSSPCATSAGGNVMWDVGMLANGAMISCPFKVMVVLTGDQSFSASAGGAVNDPVPANNTDIVGTVAVQAVEVPTLNQWGLLLLLLLTIGIAGHRLQRRESA